VVSWPGTRDHPWPSSKIVTSTLQSKHSLPLLQESQVIVTIRRISRRTDLDPWRSLLGNSGSTYQDWSGDLPRGHKGKSQPHCERAPHGEEGAGRVSDHAPPGSPESSPTWGTRMRQARAPRRLRPGLSDACDVPRSARDEQPLCDRSRAVLVARADGVLRTTPVVRVNPRKCDFRIP
jgi:hypothetical protein